MINHIFKYCILVLNDKIIIPSFWINILTRQIVKSIYENIHDPYSIYNFCVNEIFPKNLNKHNKINYLTNVLSIIE